MQLVPSALSPLARNTVSRRRLADFSLPVVALLLATGCGFLPLSAPGSAGPPRPARIGVVHLGQQENAPVVAGLRQGFAELGYVEGDDVVLEIRAGQGRYENALAAARELAASGVHIFVSAGTVATLAVKDAAVDRPVVFTQVGEPVAGGFVESIAHPGGSMTGFSHLLVDTTGKRLELLRQLAPSVRSVLLIYDSRNPTSHAAADEARDASQKLGISLHERQIQSRDEVIATIQAVNRDTADAILVLPDSLVVNASDQIIQVSRQHRIPVMFHEETWVRQGGLASYGASFVDLARESASYVDKILKGARPGDLPVQQATKFDFIVNLRTAEALGLTIPQSVLAQVTEAIR